MANEQRSALEDLRATLGKMGGQFKAVLQTQQHVDRFIRVVMTAVQQNVELLDAKRETFYASCMKCAQDGLMPDGKEAILKVYNAKQRDNTYEKQVQYEPMTDGLMKKLRLSGEVVGAPKVHVVHAADEFSYELGDNERIVHKPALSNRGELIAAYSIVKLNSGDTSREVMSREDIDKIMARTKSKSQSGEVFGPWKTDYSEMARKTVFKRHYKRLPRSSDLDNVINYDNEVNGAEDIQRAAPAQQAPAAPPPAQARPPALAAVAESGGTPMPAMSIEAKREPVTLDGEAKQEPAPAARQAPPSDII